jgi:hypothetical protein
MTIDEWLVNKITSSTSITATTTNVRPEFLPLDSKPPAIIYNSIGFDRNRKYKMRVITLTCLHNTKSQVESLNDNLYNLFDNSTAYIRETSSNLSVESVMIQQNGVGGFDNENKYWYRVLDVKFWYHNN